MDRKSTTRTTHHYLAGIAACGAVLACGLVGFLSLIGNPVSVWPDSGNDGTAGVIELQSPAAAAELANADGLVASTGLPTPVSAKPENGEPGDGGNDGGPQGQSPAPPDEGATPPGPAPGSLEPDQAPSGGSPQGRGDDTPGGDPQGKAGDGPDDLNCDEGVTGGANEDGDREDADWGGRDWGHGPAGGDWTRDAHVVRPTGLDESSPEPWDERDDED